MPINMNFNKPATDIGNQLAILRGRGLAIADEPAARHHLQFVGYYRFSGYALQFQIGHNANGQHSFVQGTTFETILDLYNFDRKLRMAVFEAIEKIEIGVRAEMARTLSVHYGPHWYMNPLLFDPKFKHAEFINLVKREIGHDPAKAGARQTYIGHYYSKYCTPDLPPSWMVFEALSFGTVSQIFRWLLHTNQRLVSPQFNLGAPILASWLHSVSYLRNLAAHHQRIANRKYTIKPMVAKQYQAEMIDLTRFYVQAVIINVILRQVDPNSSWTAKLQQCFSEHPTINPIRFGFTTGWEQKSFWK